MFGKDGPCQQDLCGENPNPWLQRLGTNGALGFVMNLDKRIQNNVAFWSSNQDGPLIPSTNEWQIQTHTQLQKAEQKLSGGGRFAQVITLTLRQGKSC